MKDRQDSNPMKAVYPFGQNFGNGYLPTESVFSDQNKYESQRTPMFTGGINPQQNMLLRSIPPLALNSIEAQQNAAIKTEDDNNSHDSLHYKSNMDTTYRPVFSDKEDKGSPRDSMYFPNMGEHESYKRCYQNAATQSYNPVPNDDRYQAHNSQVAHPGYQNDMYADPNSGYIYQQQDTQGQMMGFVANNMYIMQKYQNQQFE
jgi:hypothetical protein